MKKQIKKKLGRTISIILTALMLIGTIPIAGVGAAIIEGSDFTYYINDDGTLYLACYIGNDIDVVIPEEIDGHKVTGIDDNCFNISYTNTHKIESIYIPSSITVLDKEGSVFADRRSLKKLR